MKHRNFPLSIRRNIFALGMMETLGTGCPEVVEPAVLDMLKT